MGFDCSQVQYILVCYPISPWHIYKKTIQFSIKLIGRAISCNLVTMTSLFHLVGLVLLENRFAKGETKHD